jgi:outer membrane protein OmpA-like peptidoglycan-associated protein
MLKQLSVLGAALFCLAACDGPRTVARTASGGRIVDCSSLFGYGRSAGPCYDATDITRRVADSTRDITRQVPDSTRDITRRVPDDTTDRTVYCVDLGRVITAPSFMVFFDFDKSTLTERAVDTIGQAAAAYKGKGGARVVATGHTDTAGPGLYNMALSLRRANAVKDELVRDGVRAEDISVVGLGETSPLVPTGDGVREAQNRRVEIVVRGSDLPASPQTRIIAR